MTIIEISAAIAVLIFGILSYFIINTLVQLRTTLRHLETHSEGFLQESSRLVKDLRRTVDDVEQKGKNLDSMLRSLSNLGDAFEFKTTQLKYKLLENTHEQEPKSSHLVQDLAEWVVMGVSVWQKLSKRR